MLRAHNTPYPKIFWPCQWTRWAPASWAALASEALEKCRALVAQVRRGDEDSDFVVAEIVFTDVVDEVMVAVVVLAVEVVAVFVIVDVLGCASTHSICFRHFLYS